MPYLRSLNETIGYNNQEGLALGGMPENPVFSVVTVSLNHGRFIEKNIRSVLAQDYPHFEHIIVDGGSTDETVDILKKYPHLKWTSESDRGQSHALNKGFARAKGDIIAWLNSDDYYAPKIFPVIAQALKDFPIVMGGCEVVDLNSVPQLYVPNVERSWFDLLKYWIAHASPSQPSVFFRKELLDLVKRDDGTYVDEALHYAMDLDLWLRMARLTPFSRRRNEKFSMYPIYEGSKTGGDWDRIFEEMSSIYKKYQLDSFRTDAEISIVLTVNEEHRKLLPQLLKEYEKCLLPNIQVVVISEESIPLSGEGIEFKENWKVLKGQSVKYCVQELLHQLRSPIVLFMNPERLLSSEELILILRAFENDSIGMLADFDLELPTSKGRFDPVSLFSANYAHPCFVMRRVALAEIAKHIQFSSLSLLGKEVALLLAHRGWGIAHMLVGDSPNVLSAESRHQKLVLDSKEYVNAVILKTLDRIQREDPFHAVRAADGFSLKLHENVFREALLYLEPMTSEDRCRMECL